MPEFLSDEWIDAVQQLYEDMEEIPEEFRAINVVMEQRVIGMPPDGRTQSFFVIVDEGLVVDFGKGEPPVSPDAVIESTFDVARSLTIGELGAESALTTGKVKVEGDVGKLIGFAQYQSSPVARRVSEKIRAFTD